jgi:hypothetical protein
MKNLIQAARAAFGVRTRPAPPASDESKRRETDRRIVSNLSSGNVRLQQGRFTTREDIDRERERVLARKLVAVDHAGRRLGDDEPVVVAGVHARLSLGEAHGSGILDDRHGHRPIALVIVRLHLALPSGPGAL